MRMARTISKGVLSAAFVLFVALAAAPGARAQQLVADLSSHLVAITTGFVGTDVLLFGSIEGDGEVVVVVRGPEERAEVRRKTRVLGIWVNGTSLDFTGVPAYYAVATSAPLDKILNPPVMERHRIGTAHLSLRPARPVDAETLRTFRAALVRNKVRKGLYSGAPGQVTFLGRRLFRTAIHFPANVPTGTYMVEVYLVRGGHVRSAQTTPLLVSKVGVGAEVFRFAQTSSVLYGIAAVALAVAAGWIAGTIFRKA